MEAQSEIQEPQVPSARRRFHPGCLFGLALAALIAWVILDSYFGITPLGLSFLNPASFARDRLEAGDYRGAIKWADRAIAIKPEYLESYSSRAVAYEAIGDFEHAISDYTTAILGEAARSPDTPYELIMDRARVYEKMGRADCAVYDYRTIILQHDGIFMLGYIAAARTWHAGISRMSQYFLQWDFGKRHPVECRASLDELIKLFDDAIDRHPEDKDLQICRSRLLSAKEEVSGKPK